MLQDNKILFDVELIENSIYVNALDIANELYSTVGKLKSIEFIEKLKYLLTDVLPTERILQYQVREIVKTRIRTYTNCRIIGITDNYSLLCELNKSNNTVIVKEITFSKNILTSLN